MNVPELVPIGTLSECLGVSARRVHQLVQTGVLPAPLARGQYDRDACVTAYADYLDDRAAVQSDPARLALANARLRLLEMQVRERESELVSRAQVNAVAARLHAFAVQTIGEARVRLALLVARESDPFLLDQILAAEIRSICLELSNPCPSSA